MKNKQTGAILILIFTMIVWGSSYSVTKSVVDLLPPVLFAFIRFAIATLCLLPIYLLRPKKSGAEKFKRSDYWWLVTMGLTGITFYYVFFNYALIYTSASSGALIQGFIPICIALFGVLFLKERLSWLQMLGIGLSFAGVGLVGLVAADDGAEKNSVLGNLLMIISVLCWAAYTIISRKLSHISPLSITFWSGCIGTVLLFPVALYEFSHLNKPIHLNFESWLSIVYLGAISSAFCYLMYNKALEKLPASLVGNFLNLDILIGVLIAVFFLHEKISTIQMGGGVLILSGLILSSRKVRS